jgi:hypothetical protein
MAGLAEETVASGPGPACPGPSRTARNRAPRAGLREPPTYRRTHYISDYILLTMRPGRRLPNVCCDGAQTGPDGDGAQTGRDGR